ncbi:MAG: hypothetical protein LBF15_06315 [Candidatus Peribacteria bacterium]|nr:hypothetical protein [Candidatus Peribacteria bacterium]
MPLASIQNEIAKTVLPYTDFDDKSYIFNRETELYEANRDNVSGVKPEIWH